MSFAVQAAPAPKKSKAPTAHHATPKRGKRLKSGKGRRGAKAPRVRRSYQQAPTPERYRQIQQALAGKGYYHGPVNGQWGADSEAALRGYQQDNHLDGDGKLTSLSLIGLGLGPQRALTAQAAPAEQKP